MKKIAIELDGVTAEAELLEGNAPRATAAFWNALPIETKITHSIWSGRACGFSVAALAALDGLEHAVCSIYPGTLVARSDGEVLISYGAAECRSALGVEYATRIARLVGNTPAMLAQLARMHDEGDKTIRVRRLG